MVGEETVGTRVVRYEALAPRRRGMDQLSWARDARLGRDVADEVVHPRLAA